MLEEVDEIQVNPQAFIDWVVYSLCLSVIHDFLDIKHCESTEDQYSTVQPDVEEGWAWPEDLEQVDTNQTC